MATNNPRFERERKTLAAMIAIYCRGRHGRRKELCASCASLLGYAGERLDKCLFPDSKPTCAACPVHCYKLEMKVEVQEVMRYAGPRMIYRHPYLAIRHVLDARNKGPFVRRRPGDPDGPATG